MTKTTTSFTNRKLFIDVYVANPQNTKKINKYQALIDTGSMETVLGEKIISDLNLVKSNNTVIIVDANGNESKKVKYDCYLMIEGHSKTFTPNCATINREGFDLILGMDIIELLDLELKDNNIIITIG